MVNGEWLNVQTVNLISTNRILSVKHNAVRFQNTSKQSEYPGLGYLDCLYGRKLLHFRRFHMKIFQMMKDG